MRLAIASLLLSTALTGQVLYPDWIRAEMDARQVKATLASMGHPDVCAYVICFDSTLGGILYSGSVNTYPACSLTPPGNLAAVQAYLQAQSPPLRAACVFLVWDMQTGQPTVIPYLQYTLPRCCLVPYGPTTLLGRLDAWGNTAPGGTIYFNATQAQTANASTFLFFAPRPGALTLPEGQVLIDTASTGAPMAFPGMVGGTATLPITVPPLPGLVGLDLFLQGMHFDPAAAEPTRLTNGLIVTLR